MKLSTFAGVAVTLAAWAGLPVIAAAKPETSLPGDGAGQAEQPRWVVQISPYGWMTGLHGDVSPFRRAPAIAVDKSFGDVLEELKIGGFVNIWARYERIVFSVDAMYVDSEDARSIGALPGIGRTPGLGASIDTTMASATFQAGYRIYDSPATTVDLLAGIRWWQLSNTATARYGAFSVAYKEKFGWVDPLVGVRAFHSLSDQLSLMAQLDIGGFNAGSRLTWQALATVNYAFTDSISASLGYKFLAVDYEADGHVFDTRLSGPVIGMTYRF